VEPRRGSARWDVYAVLVQVRFGRPRQRGAAAVDRVNCCCCLTMDAGCMVAVDCCGLSWSQKLPENGNRVETREHASFALQGEQRLRGVEVGENLVMP